MRLLKKRILVFCIGVASLMAGCVARPSVQIFHSPIVARSNETVTFTATVITDGSEPVDVQILVNAALVKTCTGLSAGDTCTYVGGPYTAYEGTTVSYLANATDSEGRRDSRGYYFFGITDTSDNWSASAIPARSKSGSNFDILFHRASDYGSFGAFLDDVEDKIVDIYAEQDIIELPANLDDLDFYVFREVAASTANCGVPHADANTDAPWRELDAILHIANFGDCTSLSNNSFTAEGGNTKAFLHESGHGIFDLGDEYDGCNTFYFNAADEPNIFETEAACRAEQTDKSRDPDVCRQFTACQGGWWGIHQDGDGNVMQIGNVNDPWGTEAAERVRWWFNQLTP